MSVTEPHNASHEGRDNNLSVEQLNAIGVAAWRNPYAITVVLPKPSAVVLDKWQLAVEEDIAHIMVMPHVDRARIDRIVADIAANPA